MRLFNEQISAVLMRLDNVWFELQAYMYMNSKAERMSGWSWIVVVVASIRISVSLKEDFREASGESLYFRALSLDL